MPGQSQHAGFEVATRFRYNIRHLGVADRATERQPFELDLQLAAESTQGIDAGNETRRALPVGDGGPVHTQPARESALRKTKRLARRADACRYYTITHLTPLSLGNKCDAHPYFVKCLTCILLNAADVSIRARPFNQGCLPVVVSR